MLVNFSFNSGMILPTTLEAPVDVGMIFWASSYCYASFPDWASTVLSVRDGIDWLLFIHSVKVILDDFGSGGSGIGGAGGIDDNLEKVFIILMVLLWKLCWGREHHKYGSISRRCRDDDPFSSSLQVSPRPNRLHNIFSTSTISYNGGILLLEDRDGFPIADKLLVLSLDCATEVAMCEIILGHVRPCSLCTKGSVDDDNFLFVEVKRSSGIQALNMDKLV